MSTPPISTKSADKHVLPKLDVTKNIVILTGAGISAESGLSTFRDSNGLWCNHKVEDVASLQGFQRNPALVQDFYNQRRAQLKDVNPNAAHCALAVLEKQWQGDFLLVTQNVDNLHSRAGNKNIIYMHGELVKARCRFTDQIFDWEEGITDESACPCCKKTGSLRPHIVWFGEIPLEMERIYQAIVNCDIFISIGTSGNVYPAAGFVYEAKQHGATTIELNLEPSDSTFFDHGVYGPATELIPQLVKKAK